MKNGIHKAPQKAPAKKSLRPRRKRSDPGGAITTEESIANIRNFFGARPFGTCTTLSGYGPDDPLHNDD